MEMATEISVMEVIRVFRPTFRNRHDKIAFAVHAFFFASGFSLIATGKNALSDNPPSDGEEVGIAGWNKLEDAYAFVYVKTEDGLKKTILVKCLPMDDLLTFEVLDLNDPRVHIDGEVVVEEFLSDVEHKQNNYTELYHNLKFLVFILNDLVMGNLEPESAVQ